MYNMYINLVLISFLNLQPIPPLFLLHLDISTEHTAAVTSHLQGDCKTTGHLLRHTKEKIRGTQGKEILQSL